MKSSHHLREELCWRAYGAQNSVYLLIKNSQIQSKSNKWHEQNKIYLTVSYKIILEENMKIPQQLCIGMSLKFHY